jgi:hypothetical protein
MFLLLILLAVISTAAFTNGRLSRIIQQKVIDRNTRLLTASSKNELAKQALSNYIENIRDKRKPYTNEILSSRYSKSIDVEGAGGILKLMNEDSDQDYHLG